MVTYFPNFSRPYGTYSSSPLFAALKRRAIFGRPFRGREHHSPTIFVYSVLKVDLLTAVLPGHCIGPSLGVLGKAEDSAASG